MFHIYDARKLNGPIKIEPGSPGEIITFSDDAGAFGTITGNLSLHHAGTDTKDALQLVFSSIDNEGLKKTSCKASFVSVPA